MRRGFGFHDRHSSFRFNPATLFAGGAVQGAWYDPSDLTTLFQDSAGTTPVTAVEQPVGRILDKSGNGNHAYQTTSASRPTLRARYNLLTYSEQFDNVVWSAIRSSVSANATAAPNGTLTADKLSEDSNSGTHIIFQSFGTAVAATNYTISAYLKNDGARYAVLALYEGITGTNIFAGQYDLQTGTITGYAKSGGNTPTGTITNIGNGWYYCTLTCTTTTGGASAQVQIWLNRAGTFTANPYSYTGYTGNGTSGIFLWGAQLVPTAVFPSNTYQRVGAATDYATGAAFPPYLFFDGVDDSMLTNSVDFTGTDKMTVWAGVTKSSDAAQGVVAELSATIASNNGAFLLSAPNSAAANYNWSSKGTTQVDNTVTTYAAPNTAVLTGQANIAGPSNIIRVNGAQAGSVATTQGTGNYGNYPLYIGRRNNASLPFNGRLYGLIVLGAAASSWQVQVTEQWMAGKTGLQF